ncbi:MAG TPA: T9SS type A sorting domain-containing protein, partial [Chitinophagaceae bacterium]|nr:T9SS type A sorting domain-containing protein [Chitinophagaceae bacterium]
SGSLPFSLRWTLDGVTLGGITSNNYTAGITRLGNYRVDITDAKGCTNQSNVLPITDSVSTKLFIFPNPAKTTVELAYYNPGGLAVNWQLIVYNANGSKVLFDRITNTGTYPKIIENVGRLTGGVYFAILSDSSGKVLATGKLLIQQ